MQRNLLLVCGLGLAVLSLGGCSRGGGPQANRGICFDFKNGASPAGSAAAAAPTGPAGAAAAAAADPGAVVDDCVRRWAYSLAPSTDSAQDAAAAAVGACTGALARWNEQSLGQPNGVAQAPSITTGESTNPLAEHNSYAHSRALLYVVEARAGRCAPPPSKNGVPVGTTD